MTEISLANLLDVALCAAEAAGKHALNNKHRRTEVSENHAHDIKLALDLECQAVAEEIIASAYPAHSVLGEEGIQRRANEYEWIIDPIDGTMNYYHDFPYWCSSVAVRHNKMVLAGCVYAPERNAYYTAHVETEARLNSDPIRVSSTDNLMDALVFTGLTKYMNTETEHPFDILRTLALDTQKMRINGSAALDICHVADGTCDGFIESIYLWDFAAAGLIAEQAGAKLSLYPSPDITHGYNVLCANEHLIEDLRDIYTQHN